MLEYGAPARHRDGDFRRFDGLDLIDHRRGGTDGMKWRVAGSGGAASPAIVRPSVDLGERPSRDVSVEATGGTLMMVGTEQVAARAVRVLALLFGSGALLVAVALLFPFFADANVAALWTILSVAIIVTVVLTLAADRVAEWPIFLPLLLGFGSVLVATGTYFAGVAGSSLIAIFFVYACGYSFYYFPLRVAVAETVWAAVLFAVALALLGSEAAIAQWIIVIGVSAVAGAVIGGAGARDRRLLEREHEVVEGLRAVDEMKTALLRAVAHDVRNPLMAIAGFAEVLLMDREMEDAQRLHLTSRIVANANELNTLVDDLLHLDRIAAGRVNPELEEVDVSAVVGRAVASASADRPERVDIDADAPITAAVDRARFERAIANLVSNALRYTPEDSPVRVGVRRDGDELRVEVDDRGPGIPDDQKEAVFEPFVRGSQAARTTGTGLGLSLVRQFAELHGGRVWVEDPPEGGARFVFVVPAGGVRQPEVESVAGGVRRRDRPTETAEELEAPPS
jgi:signal transduction histidine kinase